MSRRRVYLESPYRAEDVNEHARNQAFLHCCMLDSMRRGEAPLASHLVYAPLLDESVPEERAMGIECGLVWGEAGAEATVVYTNLGITPGMLVGIEAAERAGRPVEYRELKDWDVAAQAMPVAAMIAGMTASASHVAGDVLALLQAGVRKPMPSVTSAARRALAASMGKLLSKYPYKDALGACFEAAACVWSEDPDRESPLFLHLLLELTLNREAKQSGIDVSHAMSPGATR